MSVTSYTVTQYDITCNGCGYNEVCPDGNAENVHGKRLAAKWANMKILSDGTVLCQECYQKYKQNKKQV